MKFPRFLRQWLKCVCCLWLFSIVKRVQAKTSVRHFLHHWVLSGRKSSGNTVILFYIFVYHAIQISKKVRMTITRLPAEFHDTTKTRGKRWWILLNLVLMLCLCLEFTTGKWAPMRIHFVQCLQYLLQGSPVMFLYLER